MAILVLEQLSLSRQGFVLGPLSFSLDKGEKLALIGTNGSGKSSLLMSLSGRLRVQSGSVALKGSLRFSNGHFQPTPEWTTEELLRDALGESATDAIKFWELQSVVHQRVANLSLGFQQRVSLACACFANADIILLDEPSNGLDPKQWHSLNEWLKMAHDKAVILVTHQPERLPDTVHRALVLEEGQLTFDGLRAQLPEPWSAKKS